MNLEQKKLEKTRNFFCEKCNFTTGNKNDYRRHITTRKHLLCGNLNDLEQKNSTKLKNFICTGCNKNYLSRNGLWYHKQKCSPSTPLSIPVEPELTNSFIPTHPDGPIDMHMIVELLKQNQEFKELIIEQNKYMIELASKTGNTNNIKNQHNNFNLNVFLNETCKDAVCINDFIQNLPVSFQQLENIEQNGYVAGITNVILTQLKTMDISQRPLHCTDAKRDTMYIKQLDEWIKDDTNNTMMTHIFRRIANNNLRTIQEWSQMHPSSLESGTKENDFCTNAMLNSLGAYGDAQLKLDNMVLKCIAKSVLIDRTL